MGQLEVVQNCRSNMGIGFDHPVVGNEAGSVPMINLKVHDHDLTIFSNDIGNELEMFLLE